MIPSTSKLPRRCANLFSDLPEALENTMRIADACDLSIEFDRLRLPHYPTPNGEDADAYLAQLCEEGFRRHCTPTPEKLPANASPMSWTSSRKTQFANYFLVVMDICHLRPGARRPLRCAGERSRQRGPLLPWHYRHRPAWNTAWSLSAS